MPRQSHYNRQFLIYLPTEKDLDNWKELAKAAWISLNKYIFEMVERGRVEAQPRTDLIKEISDLREENQKQREEIKLKSLVLEKYETELFKFIHESFLQPEFQGTQQFSEALVNLCNWRHRTKQEEEPRAAARSRSRCAVGRIPSP